MSGGLQSMANLSDTTISLSSLIQLLSPVAVAVMGGASWTIKRIVGKIEASIESLQRDFDDMESRCQKAEERIKKTHEESDKAVKQTISETSKELWDTHKELEKECRQCRDKRIEEHADCIDTYGKFGSRLTGLEREHNALHSRGAACIQPPAN
jgi:septal ring factor EnvC (AmiA/AmiB activator)